MGLGNISALFPHRIDEENRGLLQDVLTPICHAWQKYNMRHTFTTSPERRVGCMMDGEGWYNSGNSLKTSCAVARVTHETWSGNGKDAGRMNTLRRLNSSGNAERENKN